MERPDADDPGDLSGGQLAIVEHALRLAELGPGELGRAAADTAAGPGGGEALQGALDDHLPVELGRRGEDEGADQARGKGSPTPGLGHPGLPAARAPGRLAS